MSFGWSAGDVVTTIKLCNTLRRRFVDSPAQFAAIRDEVRSLGIVLNDLEVTLPERDLSVEQEQHCKTCLTTCQNVLNDLDKMISKYQVLENTQNSASLKVKRTWKRLTFDPQDIRDLRSRLTSSVSLMQAFSDSIDRQSMKTIQDGVSRLVLVQDEHDRAEILGWISKTDQTSVYQKHIKSRTKGSGQWMLNHSHFQEWLAGRAKNIFCPGIPGAGKTIIASTVIEHLLMMAENEEEVMAVYAFCDYGLSSEQDCEYFLASMLQQLVKALTQIPREVRALYERQRTRPTLEEYSDAICASIPAGRRVYVVLDALDECKDEDSTRTNLLKHLTKSQQTSDLRLFVTSRPLLDIASRCEDFLRIEVAAQDEDVQNYVQQRVLSMRACQRDSSLGPIVEAEIVKAVDGMFLLAKLHLDSIFNKPTTRAVKKALTDLPRGSTALQQAYEKVKRRIESQDEDMYKLALKTLCLVAFVFGTLRLDELRHALGVSEDDSNLDLEGLPYVEDIISACAGLISVDEDTKIVRLIHYTAQEYIKSVLPQWSPDPHGSIVLSCFSYLLLEDFADYKTFSPGGRSLLRMKYPFLDYAASHWFSHITESTGQSWHKSLDALFSSSHRLGLVYDIPNRHCRLYGHLTRYSRLGRALYVGLQPMAMSLLEAGQPPEVEFDGETALTIAVRHAPEAMVRALLGHERIDINARNGRNTTALEYAARLGHEDLIQLLCSRQELEVNEHYIRAVKLAVQYTDVLTVRLLLEKDGVQESFQNEEESDLLIIAARSGQVDTVKLLLGRKGVLINKQDSDGATALISAAMSWNVKVLEILLKQDNVAVNMVDRDGRSALSWAASYGRKEAVKVLLDRNDINPNLFDHEGRTPSYWAAYSGRMDVVRLMCSREEVDLDFADFAGKTPLFAAASNGYLEIVEFLLQRTGRGAGFVDPDGHTLLSHVVKVPLAIYSMKYAQETHLSRGRIVESLLRYPDVNPDSQDSKGYTPLWWALYSGSADAARILVARPDVNKSHILQCAKKYSIMEPSGRFVPMATLCRLDALLGNKMEIGNEALWHPWDENTWGFGIASMKPISTLMQAGMKRLSAENRAFPFISYAEEEALWDYCIDLASSNSWKDWNEHYQLPEILLRLGQSS